MNDFDVKMKSFDVNENFNVHVYLASIYIYLY